MAASNASAPPRFVADSTLGRLAKYLRLAGFDTLWDPRVPVVERLAALAEGRRIVLTRSRMVAEGLRGQAVLFVTPNDPADQMAQVIQSLGLRLEDLAPLTRCGVCNLALVSLDREAARGRMPDYVWRHQARFFTCVRCGRVYWKGTHARRWLDRMTRFFEARNDSGVGQAT